MMKFKLKHQYAEVSGVNQRKELHGDEKEVAFDLSVALDITPDILNQMCADEGVPNYSDFFHDANKMVKNTGVKVVEFAGKYEDHEMSLSFSGLEYDNIQYFKEVTVKKIKAYPINGGLIKLSFMIQLRPSEQDILMLVGSVLQPCYIGIEGPDQSDFIEDGSE